MSSQDLIEEIIYDSIQSTELVDLRFSTRAHRILHGGDPGDDHVEVEIEDLKTGEISVLRGAALIAADGAASTTREQLGLQMIGHKAVHNLVNCYFRADIEAHLGGRQAVLFFVNNAQATGVLQPLDGNGRWLAQIGVAHNDWSPEAFTKDRARDWIKAAAGVPGLDVDVLSLGFWQLNATTIEKFVQGRVVFCGDAAHQFPPTGGLGVNTGLQGMHNVMWKLAAYVKGEAGWGLVETYEAERHPVAREIVQQSFLNSVNVARINASQASGTDSGLTTEEIVTAARRYGNHLGVEFGAHYTSAAVIPDGTQPPVVADSYSDYRQSATPGSRAPHIWLGRPQNRLSTLHLLGDHFTVLAARDGQHWRAASNTASAALGFRIECHVIGTAGLEDDGQFEAAYGVAGDGAVLIRPDGHVALRIKQGPADAAALVDALRRIHHLPI